MTLSYARAVEILDYDPDTGVITRGGKVAGYVACDGYRRLRVYRKNYLAHRLAWMLTHGAFPERGLDHINRVKDDNRIVNLREATAGENHQNQVGPRSHNRSGVRGVCWCKRDERWIARITANGKSRYLGRFDSLSGAAEAYAIARAYNHPYAP
jgi:HNH endonuclease/AP2 domain